MKSPMPISLLHRCAKVAYEPPRGVRATLLQTIAQDFLQGGLWDRFCSTTPGRRLLVAASLFHAVLKERHRFGPIGFNHVYDFGPSDRSCGLHALDLKVDRDPDATASSLPSWDALHCIIADLHYGGRVTDSPDRRCIATIFAHYVPNPANPNGCAWGASGHYGCFQDLIESTPPKLDDLRVLAEKMPEQGDPALFGMHGNAEIALRSRQASVLEILGLLEAAEDSMPQAQGATRTATSGDSGAES